MATDRQREIAAAVAEHGSSRKAADALGVHHSTVDKALSRLRRDHPDLVAAVGEAAAAQTSVYWRRTKPGDDGSPGISALMRPGGGSVALAEFAAGLDVPRAEPVPAPAQTAASLCTVYTLTDAHIGMLAWHKEGGANWNVAEARSVIGGCFNALLQSAPASDVGVIAILGDWLHYDGMETVTPESRHVLSSDTRFPKLVEVGASIMRQVIDAALLRHARVVLVCAEGNHDPASAQWLRVMMGALYEQEPRLTVLPNKLPFYCYQHGEQMIAWHHGHKVKPAALPLLMAAQFREVWGATKATHIHTGHMHHVEEKEHSGAIVLQHPTLAARDAYAARHGWHSLRRAMAITYHDSHGEVGRVYVTPEMLC